MKDIRVKIVAVAANEAFFIPQWVYHHFYCGFYAIDIYLNRNTDNSTDIIKKLKIDYCNLELIDFNWLDEIQTLKKTNLSLQTCAYMHAYYNAPSEISYILFIDLDEFWISRDESLTVKDCLSSLAYPDAVAFDWMSFGAQDSYIMPLLSNKNIPCERWGAAKTMLRTGLNIDFINSHMAKGKSLKYLLADGSPMRYTPKGWQWEIDHTHSGEIKPYFILHDACRSPVNYLSKIARGSANWGKCVNYATTVKRSRFWYIYHKTPYMDRIYPYRNSFPLDYYIGFFDMISRLGLQINLHEAYVHQLLFALEGIRYLLLNTNDWYARTACSDLKMKLPEIEDIILYELAEADVEFERIIDLHVYSPAQISENDKEKCIDSYEKAIRLYPFATNDEGIPLFLSKYIKFLLKQGMIKKAISILNDNSLRSNRCFGISWAFSIIGNAYLAYGVEAKGISLLENCYHSLDYKSAMQFIELSSNIKNGQMPV